MYVLLGLADQCIFHQHLDSHMLTRWVPLLVARHDKHACVADRCTDKCIFGNAVFTFDFMLQHIYCKCNFPVQLIVRLSVGRSVIIFLKRQGESLSTLIS